MTDSKDSTMKLFGKTFSLRRNEEASSNDEQSASISVVDSEAGESCCDRKVLVSSSDNTACGLPDGSSDDENKENSAEDPNSDCKESSSQKSSKSEVSDSAENKTLKKPEKIVPCPRCNSMETKFCYFNNYNVNQPRHFCKNCQRYWTAGGTMRNVPVGAGRRKNKNSAAASHYRHLVIPDSLHSHPTGILTFGSSDSPLLDCDNQSSSSSVTASNSSDHHHHQAPASFPGPPPPWQYWAPQPGFCHSGYPVSFFPTGPFWGPNPGAWTAQQQSFPGPAQPGILGKRSRVDGEVLMPKTLRIDDPAEAAKSSIWATLGIRNEKTGSSGMFEPFQSNSKSKGDDASRSVKISPAMHANPAAMSRSLRFLESA